MEGCDDGRYSYKNSSSMSCYCWAMCDCGHNKKHHNYMEHSIMTRKPTKKPAKRNIKSFAVGPGDVQGQSVNMQWSDIYQKPEASITYIKPEPLKVRRTITGSDGVERVIRPIPTVKQIEADVAKVTAGLYAPPVSTRVPSDLLYAIGLLLAFFLITHYFGWPV